MLIKIRHEYMLQFLGLQVYIINSCTYLRQELGLFSVSNTSSSNDSCTSVYLPFEIKTKHAPVTWLYNSQVQCTLFFSLLN